MSAEAKPASNPFRQPRASSAYGFVRFIGGGLAPYVAGKIADATDLSVPFYVGGVAFVLAVFVLASGHKLVGAAEAQLSAPASHLEPIDDTHPLNADALAALREA